MKNKVITVFGTGFIGKNLIYQLLETGNIVRAVSRNPYLQGKLGPVSYTHLTLPTILRV